MKEAAQKISNEVDKRNKETANIPDYFESVLTCGTGAFLKIKTSAVELERCLAVDETLILVQRIPFMTKIENETKRFELSLGFNCSSM